jgi:hypothetical protein
MNLRRSMHGRDEKFIQNFVQKTQREESLGRPRHIWEDNIRMVLMEIGREGADWKHLAQDRDQWQDLENRVMNLQIPLKVANFLTS